jgi:hypothetical protein
VVLCHDYLLDYELSREFFGSDCLGNSSQKLAKTSIEAIG